MALPSLSSRLFACYNYIRPGERVADIGCDHGYLGIHLLKNGIAQSVIAADINEHPLSSALHNAHKYGVAEKMSFYLSNGVQAIPRDFDTLVCAGLGADTIISIIDVASWLKSEQYRLVLQCQSRRPELRKYLYENGFSIQSETLAQDGKFIYPIMEVVYLPAPPLTPGGYHISPQLQKCGSPLLPAFYSRVVDGLRTTVNGLSKSGGEKHDYYKSALNELSEMEELIYGNSR